MSKTELIGSLVSDFQAPKLDGKKATSSQDHKEFMNLLKDKAQEARQTIQTSEKVVMQHLMGAKIDENQIVDSVNKMFMLLEAASSLRDRAFDTLKQLQTMPI